MVSVHDKQAHASGSKKTLFLKVGGAIVFSLLLGNVLGRVLLSNISVPPSIQLSANTLDFGVLAPGASATRRLEIVNKGLRELDIQQANGTCGCTKVSLSKTKLSWGEAATLEVTLTPKTEYSSAQVFIETNDPRHGQLVVSIASKNPNPFVILPPSVEFDLNEGYQDQGPKTVEVGFSEPALFDKTEKLNFTYDSSKLEVVTQRDAIRRKFLIRSKVKLDMVPVSLTTPINVFFDEFKYEITVGIHVASKIWFDPSPMVIDDIKNQWNVTVFKRKDVPTLHNLKASLSSAIARDFDVKIQNDDIEKTLLIVTALKPRDRHAESAKSQVRSTAYIELSSDDDTQTKKLQIPLIVVQ